jgi:hypothetical protein
VSEPDNAALARAAIATVKASRVAPVDSDVLVSGYEMRVSSVADSDLLQSGMMTEVSFSLLDKKNKHVVCFITVDSNAVMLCHVLKTKVPVRSSRLAPAHFHCTWPACSCLMVGSSPQPEGLNVSIKEEKGVVKD